MYELPRWLASATGIVAGALIVWIVASVDWKK